MSTTGNDSIQTRTKCNETQTNILDLPEKVEAEYVQKETQTETCFSTDLGGKIPMQKVTVCKAIQTDKYDDSEICRAVSTAITNAFAVAQEETAFNPMFSRLWDFVMGGNFNFPVPDVQSPKCTGTQTSTYDILANKFLTLAHEIAQTISVFEDKDETQLSRLRLLVDREHANVKVSDLIDFTLNNEARYPVIDSDRQTPPSSIFYQLGTRFLEGLRQYFCTHSDTTSSFSTKIHVAEYTDNQQKVISEGEELSEIIIYDRNKMIKSSSTMPTQNKYEIESVETCTLMTWLRYGQDIRKKRVDHIRQMVDSLPNSLGDERLIVITAGSKAEGLTNSLEGDYDSIFLLCSTVCLEDESDEPMIPWKLTVFKMDTRDCYSGHCMLVLIRRGGTVYSEILNSLCDTEDGRTILNSDMFVKECAKYPLEKGAIEHPRAGPSLPYTIGGVFHTDNVFAVPGHFPKILQEWSQRPRYWPTPSIVQKVVSMPAILAPCGFKGSESKYLEWRICFNKGETELMISLNDTQLKLYVVLKMIVKEVLKPTKKELTSYNVKNIILWLAEENPQALFNERSFFYWLHEGLRKLSTVLSTRQQNYYLIPARNLMECCGLDDNQQKAWLQTISEMISEGPIVLLRLKKTRQAIISYPEPLLWYNRVSAEMELLKKIALASKAAPEGSYGYDVILQQIYFRQGELIRAVVQRLEKEGSDETDMGNIDCNMLI